MELNNLKNYSKISACLVVYNEEKLIGRCLESIKELVDEIIVVHDGGCNDQTLEIVRKYTDKVFIRPHIGIAEPHRTFSYEQASSEWILQIDADEYFDEKDIEKIKNLIYNTKVDGYWFDWELWDGQKPISLPGLIKLALFRKNKIIYQGLPQTAVTVLGEVKKVNLFLHHRPIEDNVSWAIANRKRKYWLKSHIKYFFPEQVKYYCFRTTIDSWLIYLGRLKNNPIFYLLFYPLKNFIGQLKNGLWKSKIGFRIALQQYVYYLCLYWEVWKMNKKSK